jgi:hypothetical protein
MEAMSMTLDFTQLLAPFFWAMIGILVVAVAAVAVASRRQPAAPAERPRLRALTGRPGVRHTGRAIAPSVRPTADSPAVAPPRRASGMD